MTWRPSESPWLQGILVIGVLVVLITEGLGALKMIAPLPVAVCWALVLAVALVVHRRRTGRFLPEPPPAIPLREVHPLWWIVSGFLGLTFLIGIASAPNSWDAITYHLPRIERWVEQGHLAFWPTSVDRQLWMSPWPGYMGLQLRLLTDGDQLAFLPSWLAYLGCIVLTASVARQLGGDATAQAWSAFTMATIPVAVHQASAVQTDVVAGFWILAAVALVVEAWREPGGVVGWRFALMLAAATALAYASKGTAVLALAPWLVLLTVVLVRRNGARTLARPVVAGVAVVLALNFPHLARTQATYGSPLGAPWTLDMLQLSPLTPGRVTGNLVANLSLHAGLPWEPWNSAVESGVLWLNESLLGIDADLQYHFYGGFRVYAANTHEGEAGMPVHLLLLAGGLAAMAARGRRELPEGAPWMVIAGTIGFVLLVGVLRWQPFGTRLQLAGLIWIPACAPTLVRTLPSRAVWSAVMLLTSMPALLFAKPRPLLGTRSVLLTTRSEQFAQERPEHFSAAEVALAVAGGYRCDWIGLVTGWDQPEYFLTVLARRENMDLQWEHLLSVGRRGRLTNAGPPPEVCQVFIAEPVPGLETPWLAEQFELIWSEPPFEVHQRRGERAH